MNNEREMLELAAKAAGLTLEYNGNNAGYWGYWRGLPQWNDWNPREDDGDALRLACKLRMALDFSTAKNGPDTAFSEELEDVIAVPITKWMDTESMRLAIVRAAAEIGRGMP